MIDQIIYTKDELISRLKMIAEMEWVPNTRQGNHGGIGNTLEGIAKLAAWAKFDDFCVGSVFRKVTYPIGHRRFAKNPNPTQKARIWACGSFAIPSLEDLLGIAENNLPIPNAAEWELKAQRQKSSSRRAASLITLFHMEPSPRAFHFVPQIFLLKYGWVHQKAGTDYLPSEMSFRQTINALAPSDRGFIVKVDRLLRQILVSFTHKLVNQRHKEWLKTIEDRIGLGDLNPQPYWGFDDLKNKAGTKLLNCFYVRAKVQKREGKEFYHFHNILKLQKFSFERFLEALESGKIWVDFDARTGHNHGTKFRIRQDSFSSLYEQSTVIIGGGND
jgi:hypothetical protein